MATTLQTVEPLMRQNFLEYASYVIVDRAIPDLRDGCKPVQRRILHTLFTMDDGKFNKVANVIGECMKLHPHGDASIGDALVVLANKEYFIERQGNFGSVITGHSAAAARYIECRLTPLAKDTLFNKRLTRWQKSYDGRRDEPMALPVKLPVILLLGTDGIAVGMSTTILPHNFCELLQAQINLLRNQPIELFPDFAHGALMDVSEYADGAGRVRLRARIEARGDKTVAITEIPFGTTTEKLIASIEAAVQKGKVKIGAINDYTTDRVEIELTLPRGVYAEEVIPQLYAWTDCELSISSNICVIQDRRPVQLNVSEMLHQCTVHLRDQIAAELQLELEDLLDKQHWLTLEQIFIENRVYKAIEEATTAEAVQRAVVEGMEAFKHLFVRELIDEDVERLLKIPIRRISLFDINKNRKDIDDIVRAIKAVEAKLKQLTKTVIAYLDGLLEKYGPQYPRRTEITTFTSVDKKAVARAAIKLAYDAASGFIGTAVKGEAFPWQVSEFDKILIISDDGSYRVISPEDKFLVPGKLLWAGPMPEEGGLVFTVVYRDKDRNAFAKKVRIDKFTRGREYELIKDKAGKLDRLMEGEASGVLTLDYVAAKRQRVTSNDFDLATLEFCGPSARGTRIAPKPVSRIKNAKA
ncbi:MAG: DNA topoisomerase IV subunit A [Planctomycetota bacterium]|nr:MAG: DNA topoisomerase IV subunit A [Planctomycetota bacterium]